MAKVSIIIPVYNVEEYLIECMDSVVGQTLDDLEIICVNDGSTDRSLDILKQYQKQDKRIMLIDKENGGYGHAMNCGLDHATGEYIGIVEPDDYVPLNMYEDLYKKAVEHNLDFVKADFYRFKRSESGSMELYYNHLSPKKEDYNVVFNPSETPEALRFIMNTWSGIYRREFLEEYHIRHHETPGAAFQDNGFWFQTFVYAKRAMILDKPYYMNRRDNPNSSVNSREKVYCINIEYDYIREMFVKKPELWKRFCHMYWFKKYHNYMGTLWRIGAEYKQEYILRFSEELKRGKALGELKKEVFSETAWNNIRSIMEDPERYYITRVYPVGMSQKVFEYMNELEVNNQKLRDEISGIRSSISFRLGRKIMYLPGKLRKLLGGRRK
ncbi:MAG: glycosyltransferase family 2 protein [Lachnospiraceae bacterium]